MESQWKFNKQVASSFVQHARCHIPDYDKVIDLSVNVCRNFDVTSKIIDVGCATGETLRRLTSAGFKNVYGVDNSKDMLQHCNVGSTICSDKFPQNFGPFKVIILNWTLHFIKEKKDYLKTVIENLDQDGILILSDKIDNTDFSLNYYHQFKRNQGVTEEEIKAKADSLVGVMFIDDIHWYLETFKELNLEYHLANGHWSFATFVCRKK
jgi:2-polyprenyl-3-methyl-5-hydroxy-6-metoxy-1,4-benzoquinol methylase